MKTNLRSVKVTYADGNIIYTDMAARLTDNEILSYFAVGKVFNIGNVDDSLQAVTECEIIK